MENELPKQAHTFVQPIALSAKDNSDYCVKDKPMIKLGHKREKIW